MKCTILGCGGSLGVPQLTCDCMVCTSDNPKNTRMRCSILIESDTSTVLVDTSPDFRQQAMKFDISKVDAVIFTHAHYDHIAGLDDIKPLAYRKDEKYINAYMTDQTFGSLSRTHFYAFEKYSIYQPFLKANIISEFDEIQVGDIKIELFNQSHGDTTDSLGIKIGNFAYSTDMNDMPQKSLDLISGVDNWIVDLLRYCWAPTHNSYEAALDWIDKVQPKNAIFTHMLHEIDYDEIDRITPDNIAPAYDGMQIEIKP